MMYLGIDFGTSFTKAAVFDPSTKQTKMVQLNTISSDNGVAVSKYIMPTCVYVKTLSNGKQDLSVGYEAINKRLLPDGDFYEKFKPFLDYPPGSDNFRAIDFLLVNFILKSVRAKANSQFGQNFKSVVLTIPASTPKNGHRWNLMYKAAHKAGFTDVTLIAEPEAAAYCLLGEKLHSNYTPNNSYFLIYDFGGGTFDTSVVRISDHQIFVENESVGSDNSQRWGGIYIDDIIKRDYIKRSPKASALVDKLRNGLEESVQRSVSDHFRTEPLKAKMWLSTNPSFKNFYQDYILTKEDFENLIEMMVTSTIDCSTKLVETTDFEDSSLNLSNISCVYLVGGTSKIPLVSSLWNRTKKGKNASFDIMPSPLEVVAQGAAQYHFFKLSDRKLIAEGKKKVEKGEYRTAAKYFSDANTEDGWFNVAILYYAGVLNPNHKKEYTKAIRIFDSLSIPEASEMLAIMHLFGQGFLQSKENAKKIIDSKIEKTPLCNHIYNVITGSYSKCDLDAIYCVTENPLKLI